MGSMTDDEYTSRFMELLRYVPYLKEDKAKIQRFTSGLLMEFKDRIEFDEPKSLDEAIRKLKHCYEQSKRKSETKPNWKVHISSDKGNEVEDAYVLSRYLILQHFKDVSPEDISEFPPHKEVYFSIELFPGATLASKSPYRMSTLELVELKIQLQEMLDKG
eukprot:PITA_23496